MAQRNPNTRYRLVDVSRSGDFRSYITNYQKYGTTSWGWTYKAKDATKFTRDEALAAADHLDATLAGYRPAPRALMIVATTGGLAVERPRKT